MRERELMVIEQKIEEAALTQVRDALAAMRAAIRSAVVAQDPDLWPERHEACPPQAAEAIRAALGMQPPPERMIRLLREFLAANVVRVAIEADVAVEPVVPAR